MIDWPKFLTRRISLIMSALLLSPTAAPPTFRQDSLMPRSALSVIAPLQRFGPVYLESELVDPVKYQQLSHALARARRATIFCPSRFFDSTQLLKIQAEIELKASLKQDFLRHVLSTIQEPLFLLVRQEKADEIAQLVKTIPGDWPVVIIPYMKDGSVIQFQMVTQKSDLTFLPNLAFYNFFSRFKQEELDFSLKFIDPSSEIGQLNISSHRVIPESLLPYLANYTHLPSPLLETLIQKKDQTILKILAQRHDLQLKNLAQLIDMGESAALQELVLFQCSLLVPRPSLCHRLIEKLFSKDRKGALQFLEKFTADRFGGPEENGFLKEVVNAFVSDAEDAGKIKTQILDHPFLPFWAKGRVVATLLRYQNLPMRNGKSYTQNICEALADEDFLDWFFEHNLTKEDPYALWLRVVVSAPEFPILRQKEILDRLKTHYDLESLQAFALFFEDQYKQGWKELPLQDVEEASLLVQLLALTVTSHISHRKSIFNRTRQALENFEQLKSHLVQPVLSLSEFIKDNVDFIGGKATQGERKLDPTWVLPLFILSRDHPEILESFKEVYSAYHIYHSRDLRSSIANELLLLSFSRQGSRWIEKILRLKGNSFKNDKKSQKKFVKALQSVNTVFQMEQVFREMDGVEEQKRQILLAFQESIQNLEAREVKNFDEFINSWYEVLLQLFSYQISPELKQKLAHTDVWFRLRDVIRSYLLFQTKWQEVHPEGVEVLKRLMLHYLLTGENIKSVKYGEDPQNLHARKQMEVLRAVLRRHLEQRFQNEIKTNPELWQQRISRMVDAFLAAWKKDLQETVFPINGQNPEPRVVWTQDTLESWINIGQEGAESCLRADNDPLVNRVMLGKMLSGLCHSKFIGNAVGDMSTRVHESLAFKINEEGVGVVLVDEQMFSTFASGSGGERNSKQLMETIEVAIVSALRNASLTGASRILLPNLHVAALREAFLLYQEQLLSGFYVLVDHRDATGRLLFREKVKIRRMRDLDPNEELVALEEKNRWRIWVGVEAVYGVVPLQGLEHSIVDQQLASEMELAGVPCRGMRLTIPGLEVELEKEIVHFWDEEATPPGRKEWPKQVKVLTEEALDEEKNIFLRELADSSRTTATPGKRLDQVYRATEKLINFVSQHDPKGNRGVRVVISIPRGGIPLARLFKRAWEKNCQTGYLRAKEGEILHKDIPKIQRNRERTFYLIDQVIVSGTSIMNCIEALKKDGVQEEEIVIVSLSAYPDGIENIVRNYPAIKAVYVGAAEGDVSDMANAGEMCHPLEWPEGAQVELGGKTYTIRYRIESQRSFNLFLATDEAGKPVAIKSVVSDQEGKAIMRIAAAVKRNGDGVGLNRMIHYDTKTAVLVTEYVEGKVLGKRFSDLEVPFSEKIREFEIFMSDMIQLAHFLLENRFYSVHLALDNIHWDSVRNKWIVTNLNVNSFFNDEKNGFTEKELLAQIQKVVGHALNVLLNSCHNHKRHAGLIKSLCADLREIQPQQIQDLEKVFHHIQESLERGILRRKGTDNGSKHLLAAPVDPRLFDQAA